MRVLCALVKRKRDVCRRNATQGVYQGLLAQMSVEKVRHAQTRCHRKHRMKIGCADGGIEAELCAERVEYTAWNGDCLRTCQDKGRDVCKESTFQNAGWNPFAHMTEKVRERYTAPILIGIFTDRQWINILIRKNYDSWVSQTKNHVIVERLCG